MTKGLDLAEVLAALRDTLVARMTDIGWRAREQGARCDAHRSSGEIAELSLPLRENFSATATFVWEQRDDGALNASGGIVLLYEPALALLQRLAGSEVVGAAPIDAFVETLIGSTLEASVAAERLGAIAADRPALEALADVDRIVDLLSSRQAMPFDGDLADVPDMDPVHWEHAVGQLMPAILAGAGRFEETRRALTTHQRPAGAEGWSPREYRRFVRQLERFLGTNGELALPHSPPSWPAAITTERSPLPGATVMPGEVQVPLRSSDRGVYRLGVLRDLWGSLRAPAREDQSMFPDDAPEGEQIELEPPDRAAYPIFATGADRVAVRLRSTMRDAIDRIAGAVPAAIGMRLVTVWFTQQAVESPEAFAGLNVHIGSQCVGDLDRDVAERLRPAIEAAAERDEDPWAYAYLTAGEGAMPYRLEIALPEHAERR